MLLIQKGKPIKRYCDRCHRRITAKVCDCRSFERAAARHAKRFYEQALALQAELAARRNVG